jgi:hypothetical protein
MGACVAQQMTHGRQVRLLLLLPLSGHAHSTQKMSVCNTHTHLADVFQCSSQYEGQLKPK